MTDRGRTTHVLLSIGAYRELSGEQPNILELISAPNDSGALAVPDAHGSFVRRTLR
ncbi:MAG: hypothetical protein ABIT10_07015 [Alteraurantiacibacter sp.]